MYDKRNIQPEKIIRASNINWTHTSIMYQGSVTLSPNFQVLPYDFLRFANQDFSQSTIKGRINALTNAKRAIDCQIDSLLHCIGYEHTMALPLSAKEYIRRTLSTKLDIPEKLKLIYALDIAPTSLITKTTKIRNLLEHEYQCPSIVQVEECLEISELFVRVVDALLTFFVDDFSIGNYGEKQTCKSVFGEGDRELDIWRISVKIDSGTVKIKSFSADNKEENCIIKSDEVSYLNFIKLAICLAG